MLVPATPETASWATSLHHQASLWAPRLSGALRVSSRASLARQGYRSPLPQLGSSVPEAIRRQDRAGVGSGWCFLNLALLVFHSMDCQAPQTGSNESESQECQ